MKTFAIVAACLSLVAAFLCLLIVPKFSQMFDELEVPLPLLTTTVVETSGWIPGGMFLVLAATLVLLALVKKDRITRIVAVFAVVSVIATSIILPFMLFRSLVVTISTVEDDINTNKMPNKADMATPSKPSN